MRVLVCGSRNAEASNRFDLIRLLNELHNETPITEIVHGACDGPDTWAREWALRRTILTCAFPAEWDKHGRAAGPIRNQRMIDEKRPDLVVAVWDMKSRGTADMVNRAIQEKIPVRITYRREYWIND